MVSKIGQEGLMLGFEEMGTLLQDSNIIAKTGLMATLFGVSQSQQDPMKQNLYSWYTQKEHPVKDNVIHFDESKQQQEPITDQAMRKSKTLKPPTVEQPREQIPLLRSSLDDDSEEEEKEIPTDSHKHPNYLQQFAQHEGTYVFDHKEQAEQIAKHIVHFGGKIPAIIHKPDLDKLLRKKKQNKKQNDSFAVSPNQVIQAAVHTAEVLSGKKQRPTKNDKLIEYLIKQKKEHYVFYEDKKGNLHRIKILND